MPDSRQATVGEMLERMEAHHPKEPHWYLPLIGVDPGAQGKGYGAALLSFGLAECDRQHKPAYLDATSERSAALYQRHGFEVAGSVQVGDAPTIWPMIRRAR